jgi:hypothetical protein
MGMGGGRPPLKERNYQGQTNKSRNLNFGNIEWSRNRYLPDIQEDMY